MTTIGSERMAAKIDRPIFDAILASALTAHGIDPLGTRGIPFDKMVSIAAHVRKDLETLGVSPDDFHQCVDWMLPEILDRSMTREGQQLAISELGKGLGLKIAFPS